MEKFIYETPQTQVVEIFAEGVLCGSGNHEGAGDGGDLFPNA